MALTDKDILITPNTGSSSADSKIEYVGADSSGNDTITVETLYDGTKATLSFEGSAGQLFSIVNDLSSDPIFSVNDVSGIPSIEVDSDGEIRLAEFSGDVIFGKSAANNTDVGTTIFNGAGMSVVRSGGAAVILNRTTSDGTIQEFRKDGSVVGVISTESGRLNIGTGDAGISFLENQDRIIPRLTSGGNANASIDLGDGASRFRNLYLSGTIDTGQGATEVYLMNQNVRTSDSPTFADLTVTGNIGINDTDPLAKLEIAGDKYILTNSGQARGGIHLRPTSTPGLDEYGGAISFSCGGSGSSAIAAVNDGGTDNDSNGLSFITHPSGTGSADSVEQMRLNESGNLGIGTTSPRNKLDIVSGSDGKFRLSQYGPYFHNLTDSSNERYIHARADGALSIGYVAIANLTGGTGGYASTTYDHITIDSSGNVGIGTVNPSSLLDVDGRITANNLTLQNLSAQNSEATAVMINGSGIIGTRELGSNAFNSTAFLTGNQTITLSGDVSGSGTTSIAVTIADDSHNHIISNVDGLQTALNAKASLSGATFTGNIIAEDSEVHVGDTSGDNWTRIKHAQADGYGFNWQHDNATVIVNEQGSTNEVLVLGDVDAGDYSGLLGVAHSTNGGTGWTKKLDLRGNGELYIGASGTNQVYHEGHKPTYSELGTMAYSNLTGTPTIPTNNNQLTNGAGYATQSYVGTQISNLVDSAPSALNTLNELAAALGDDANFSTTVTNSIATKLPLAGGTMTGDINMNGNDITNIKYLEFANEELTDFTGAYQMLVDANDTDGNVPNHGNTSGVGPFGIYFTGDDGNSTTTLGSGLVKVWHTGHFTKAHIDYFVGLYNTGVTTTEFDYLDGVTSNIQTQLNSKYDSGDNVSLGTINSGAITSSGGIDGTKISVDSGTSLGLRLHTNSGITASNNYMNFFTSQTGGWSFNANGTGADSNSVFTITSSGAVTANTVDAGSVEGNSMFINTPDGGSAPATTAILRIYGYEGRGAGIKIRDSANSASGASDREWFIGSGYAQSGFNIGYASDGSQSSYSAQNKLSIDTSGNATFAGTINSGGITSSAGITANGPFKSGGSNNYILFDYDGDFTGGNYYAIQDTSANRLRISYGFSATDNLELDASGNFYVNGGNATFAGTISSGAITSTGTSQFASLNLGGVTSTASSFLSGTQRIVSDGYIATQAIYNYGETGSNPAAIVFGSGSTYGNDQISLITSGDTALYINGSQSIGIGTESPSKQLHVKTDDNEGIFLEGTGGGVWMDFKIPASELWSVGCDSAKFGVYNRTDSQYRLIVANNSYVGIGSNDPDEQLEIDGKTAYPYMKLSSTNNTSRYMRIGMANSTDHIIEANGSSTQLIFKTDGTTALTLSDSGQLTTTNQINMPNDHYVFRQFQMDATDNDGVVYIILCTNAANNDVNGTITMDRTSGLRHACSVDIIVSAGSSATPVGTIRAMGVAGSGNPKYSLVKGTYNAVEYIALKIVNPDLYHETSGAYFTGRLVNSGSNTLTAVGDMTSVTDLDFFSNSMHQIGNDGPVLPVATEVGGGAMLYDSAEYGSGTDNAFIVGHTRASNSGSSAIKFIKQNFTGMPGRIEYYISPANTTRSDTSSTQRIFLMEGDGDFHADGDVIAYSTSTGSDRKLKENIRDLEGSLDKTLKLRGVKYDWKDERKANDQLGFIAQEVQEIVPEVVKEVKTLTKEDETHLTVNYPALVPMLVEAIKEQQTIINRLEERINNLENNGEE